MNAKLALLAAAVASGFAFSFSTAKATIIDVTPPNTPFFGQFFQGPQGVVISPELAYLEIAGSGFGNWIALGLPQFNANGSNPDVFQAEPSDITFFILNKGSAIPFDFSSIGLSTQNNDGSGGSALFTFFHQDGTVDSQVVSLATGVTGLQTFTFDEQNLNHVSFFGLNNKLLQFDNIGADASPVAVPGPVAGAGMPGLIVAFGVLIVLARRRSAGSLSLLN